MYTYLCRVSLHNTVLSFPGADGNCTESTLIITIMNFVLLLFPLYTLYICQVSVMSLVILLYGVKLFHISHFNSFLCILCSYTLCQRFSISLYSIWCVHTCLQTYVHLNFIHSIFLFYNKLFQNFDILVFCVFLLPSASRKMTTLCCIIVEQFVELQKGFDDIHQEWNC